MKSFLRDDFSRRGVCIGHEEASMDRVDIPRMTLHREKSSAQGTFGVLIGDNFRWHTVELPWKENKPNVSCIPCGTYHCDMAVSPRFGRVYHVRDVPGRTHILIHAGNYAGDIQEGYKTHSHGCILPGRKRGILGSQWGVLFSRHALSGIVCVLDGRSFQLSIIGEVG